MRKANLLKKAFKHLKKNWVKYAFETLVVILGILIAFALSNWNEDRLQNIKETQFLIRLVKDLRADSIYYKERITESENIIKNHREVIRKMYQIQHNFEEVKDLWMHIDFNSKQLTTQDITYIEMTNSGNLDILRNQELKEDIINYYRKNEEATSHFLEFNDFTNLYLAGFAQVVRNAFKFSNISQDVYEDMEVISDKDWGFFNNPDSEKFQSLEYALNTYRFKHQSFLNHFKTLKAMETQLIQDIEKELELRD